MHLLLIITTYKNNYLLIFRLSFQVTHFIITTFENANKPATSSHSFVTDNSEYSDMVEFSEDIVKSIKRLIKVKCYIEKGY